MTARCRRDELQILATALRDLLFKWHASCRSWSKAGGSRWSERERESESGAWRERERASTMPLRRVLCEIGFQLRVCVCCVCAYRCSCVPSSSLTSADPSSRLLRRLCPRLVVGEGGEALGAVGCGDEVQDRIVAAEGKESSVREREREREREPEARERVRRCERARYRWSLIMIGVTVASSNINCRLRLAHVGLRRTRKERGV